MTSKLNQILESEHLTATKLAEILEIQPSGISHILRNRNKPSYDFVVKLLRRFPRINPDWLLLDSGQMYRDDDPATATTGDQAIAHAPSMGTLFEGTTNNINSTNDAGNSTAGSQLSTAEPARRSSSVGAKEIDRVVIFYTDQTCECYKNR